MNLRELQSIFCFKISKLIDWAYSHGYELTFSDAYRDPRLHGMPGTKKGYGAANSNHKIRLAIDLNLFKDGKYISNTEGYKPLGEYWESLKEDGVEPVWGGRFKDGNHFSFKYLGRM